MRVALGAAVSAVCLYLATRGTDWRAVRAVLAGAQPGWLAGGLGACLGALLIRAQRWVRLLRPVGAVRFPAALAATAVGSAATAVLPLRMGELVRPALLARQGALGLSPALASIVLERLFDSLCIVLSFLTLSLVYPLPEALRAGARGLAAVALAACVALAVAQRQRRRSEAWLRARLTPLPRSLAARLGGIVGGVFDGLSGLNDRRTVLAVAAYSVALWCTIGLVYLCALRALAIAVPPLPAALASVVIVAAFVALPQAPGFVGTWQAGCVVALGLFGISGDQAVGYSLLTWLLSMVVSVGAGGAFLAAQRLAWRPPRSSDGR